MRKPTYNVYVTQETQPDENGEKNTYWTKVGAAFTQRQAGAEHHDHARYFRFRQAGTPRT